jgi:hypothetical protein
MKAEARTVQAKLVPRTRSWFRRIGNIIPPIEEPMNSSLRFRKIEGKNILAAEDHPKRKSAMLAPVMSLKYYGRDVNTAGSEPHPYALRKNELIVVVDIRQRNHEQPA